MNIIFIKIIFLMLSFGIIFFMVDIDYFYQYASGIDFYFVFIALFFVFLNQVLSTVRYGISLKMFGIRAGFWELHKVNIYSIFSGLVFFNFFGQGVSRSYLVRHVDESNSSFIVTAFERVISLSILLVFSIFMSLFVFGSAEIYVPSIPIIIIILFLTAVLFSVYFWMLFPRQRQEIVLVFSSGFGKRLWSIALTVIMMHVSMLCAYMSLVVGMTGVASVNANSILANVLTMLGGALPISFGGWGAREVSASFAFKAASLPSELGVSVGIGIGLLTLVALSINLLIVVTSKKIASPRYWTNSVFSGKNYGKRLVLFLAWVSAPVTIVMMMVQLAVPLEHGKLTLNIADPIAIVLGMTFVLVLVQKRAWATIWVDKKVGMWLASSGLVLTTSYIIGFIEVGYSDWALYNRFVGSGILISYFAIGVAATAFWGEFAVRTALRSAACAVVVVAITEFSLRLGLDNSSLISLGWSNHRWTGFLNNPNSYAFFLLSVFCLVFSFGLGACSRKQEIFEFVVISILILLMYLSDSKAAMLSFVILSVFFARLDWKRLLYPTICAAGIYLLVVAVNEFVSYFYGSGIGLTLMGQGRVEEILDTQPDRVLSLVEGWKMYLSNPVFGGGLGAFYENQLAKGTPLVIHNSFLWILAEMGTVGFLIIVVLPAVYAANIMCKSRWLTNPFRFAFLAVLLNAAVMGMAHELVYQRVFWLILGLLLAAPFSLRKYNL